MNFGYVLLSLAVLAAAFVIRPPRARCPSGYWLDTGVRESGDYECAPIVPPLWKRSDRGGWMDVSEDPQGAIRGRVYCTSGQRAVVVDGEAVGCMRGGWR